MRKDKGRGAELGRRKGEEQNKEGEKERSRIRREKGRGAE